MKRAHEQLVGLVGLMVLVIPCVAAMSGEMLPQPDYHQDPNDPGWLSTAARFHGHLGPWAVVGIRLGAAGRQAVEAQGYFDIEVVCEGPFSKPPKRCFLDGVQVATGATWGKGNVRWVKSSEVAVSVTNTRTGRRATARPNRSVLKMLAAIKPKSGAKPDHEHLEKLARKIANMPTADLLTISTTGRKS